MQRIAVGSSEFLPALQKALCVLLSPSSKRTVVFERLIIRICAVHTRVSTNDSARVTPQPTRLH